jgi:hypothetical protein
MPTKRPENAQSELRFVTSRSVVLTGRNDVRPSTSRWTALLKYLLLFAAVACPFASAFLVYPLPTVSDALYDLSWLCWFFIIFVSLGILLLRRWIAVAIFAAAWIWLFYGPSHGPGESFFWLTKQGFHFHASPVKAYLSRCRLVEFAENGTKQTVGFCENNQTSTIDFIVYYDTTGEFSLPLSQRTSEWKQAMSQLARDEILERRAYRFFEDFYRIEMPLEKYRG